MLTALACGPGSADVLRGRSLTISMLAFCAIRDAES